MAGVPTGIGSASASASVTSLAFTLTAAVAAGQKIVVAASVLASNITCTFSDSKGNTWNTDVGPQSVNSTCQTYLGSTIVANALTTADTITATFSAAVSPCCVCGCQISGVSATLPGTTSAFSTVSTNAWSVGPSTAVTSGIAFAAACGDNTTAGTAFTSTPAAAWTELYDFTQLGLGLTLVYEATQPGVAYTASGTFTTSVPGQSEALAIYRDIPVPATFSPHRMPLGV